jgi:hypothetical protein
MRLKEKRWIFTLNIAKLIIFINEQPGYRCALDEVKRTPEQAAIYAKQGIGVNNSKHCEGLAADIIIYKDGAWLKKSEEYEFAGMYWLALHPDNTWGGAGNDGNHFSMGGKTGW